MVNTIFHQPRRSGIVTLTIPNNDSHWLHQWPQIWLTKFGSPSSRISRGSPMFTLGVQLLAATYGSWFIWFMMFMSHHSLLLHLLNLLAAPSKTWCTLKSWLALLSLISGAHGIQNSRLSSPSPWTDGEFPDQKFNTQSSSISSIHISKFHGEFNMNSPSWGQSSQSSQCQLQVRIPRHHGHISWVLRRAPKLAEKTRKSGYGWIQTCHDLWTLFFFVLF